MVLPTSKSDCSEASLAMRRALGECYTWAFDRIRVPDPWRVPYVGLWQNTCTGPWASAICGTMTEYVFLQRSYTLHKHEVIDKQRDMFTYNSKSFPNKKYPLPTPFFKQFWQILHALSCIMSVWPPIVGGSVVVDAFRSFDRTVDKLMSDQ